MAMRLLQQGFRVAVATKPLNAAGRKWNRGTFVVRVTRNPETIHDAVAKLADEARRKGYRRKYGLPGRRRYGRRQRERVTRCQAPRIAMVADESVDQTSYRLDLVDARPLRRQVSRR